MKRVIGIIGGLGPYAHLELERHLLAASAERLARPAADQDYPPWLLSSLPATPDRTSALLSGGTSPLEALVKSVSRLTHADFGVIPCNTAHAFLDSLRQRVALPILDMIDEATRVSLELAGSGGRIGVLAATGTLQSRLYQDRAAKRAPASSVLTLLDLPSGERLQEELVMTPIFGPMEGDRRAGGGIKSGAFQVPGQALSLAQPLIEAAGMLAAEGAQVVLMACTEIPLVLNRSNFTECPVIDPMRSAADASVAIALGERGLP